MKTCNICLQEKPLDDFPKAALCKDGHRNLCKDCRNAQVKKNRQSPKGRKLANAASLRWYRSEKGRNYKQSYGGKQDPAKTLKYRQTAKYHAAQKKYAQSEKGKVNKKKLDLAHAAVRRAIKDGVLPELINVQCKCGDPATQYHHHKGYAKENWLDVIPVCIECHKH